MGYLLHRQHRLSLDQAIDGLQTNPRQAARLAMQAAAQNDAEAQALLGQMLLDGYGIAQDAALALNWFQLAARQQHAMACNMAGRCLEHGWGCMADAKAAAAYYQQAAQLGLDWGMYNLANLLATGRGVTEDHSAAFQLYWQAAHLGHAKSMNLVGRYLEEGRITPPDCAAAYHWYQRSAEAGDFRGQFSFASVLLSQNRLPEARHWLTQALSLGHLKFLRTARDELLKANLPEIADITQKYVIHCQHLAREAGQEA